MASSFPTRTLNFMKPIVGLTILALASVGLAQGPMPGMPPQGGRGSNAGQSRSSGSNSSSIPTETIRVLSLTAVQQDLALTGEEYTALSQLAPTLPAATTSEDQAFTAVSKVLTTTQSTRLEELMVQDLGYGSVALSDVRTKLSLTQDQTTQVDSLLAGLETAKKAILQLNSDSASSTRAIARVATSTNLSLENVLTADQRTKLKTLAGKSLGSTQ